MSKPTFFYVIADGWETFKEYVRSHLITFSTLLFILSPFICLAVGMYATHYRDGAFEMGGELVVPFILVTIAALMRGYANRLGRGTDCPVPSDRFTSEDEYGEVSVPTDRLQELILYTADVEDWLERKGML